MNLNSNVSSFKKIQNVSLVYKTKEKKGCKKTPEKIEVLRIPEAKVHLSEVMKVAKLILVLPATNATSERTFSLMKLIKIFPRSTIKQSRLNYLMILSAYKDQLNQLDVVKVASSIIEKND